MESEALEHRGLQGSVESSIPGLLRKGTEGDGACSLVSLTTSENATHSLLRPGCPVCWYQ